MNIADIKYKEGYDIVRPIVTSRTCSKTQSLHWNIVWIFLGNAVYAATQWAMLAIMTKIGTITMVGQYSLSLAITAPVFSFTNLQLRNIQATDSVDKHSFSEYFSLRFASVVFSMVLIAVIIAICGYGWQVGACIILVAIYKCFESLSDIIFGLQQKHEHMKYISLSMTLKGVLCFLLLSCIIYLTGNLVLGIIGIVIIYILMFALFDFPRIKLYVDFSLCLNLKALYRLFIIALPMGLVMMLISLNTNIPKYFLESYHSNADLGVYSTLLYLVVAGNMVVNAIGLSIAPRLSRCHSRRDKKQFITQLMMITVVGIILWSLSFCVVLFFGKEIITILYNIEYSKYTNALIIMIAASGMEYIASFLGYGMTAARSFKTQLCLFLFVALITVLSSYYLVPQKGIVGASLVYACSTGAQLVGSIFIIIAICTNFKTLGRDSNGHI